jgi:hypothetical protein
MAVTLKLFRIGMVFKFIYFYFIYLFVCSHVHNLSITFKYRRQVKLNMAITYFALYLNNLSTNTLRRKKAKGQKLRKKKQKEHSREVDTYRRVDE